MIYKRKKDKRHFDVRLQAVNKSPSSEDVFEMLGPFVSSPVC